MPKSKSKSSAPVARSKGLPSHPALSTTDPLLACRLGQETPLRLPDSYASPTAATVLRSEYNVSSDASGTAVFAESHNLVEAGLQWPVTAGNLAATPTATAHPQSTSFYNSARSARLVKICVQVLYVGADMTSAGYLSAGHKWAYQDLNSQSVSNVHVGSSKQVKAQEGMMVCTTFNQAPRFETPGVTTFMAGTFPVTYFAASGLPASTSVFRVRVLRYVEFLPVEGDLFEGEQTIEPGNPAAIAVNGQLAMPQTSFLSGSMSTIRATIKEAANAAYHIVQPLASQYMVGRATAVLRGMALNAMPALLAM